MTAVLPPRHVHANVPIVSAADLQLVESPLVGDACEPPFGSLPDVVRGREAQIGELRVLAAAGGVAVLSGEIGCGKTTIVLAAARALAGDHTVFWVPAHQRASFVDAMAAVASRLRVSGAEITRAREEGSADLAWRLLTAPPDAATGSARNILVIDNADDPGLAADVIRRARGLDPERWLTIVTTRIVTGLAGSGPATTLTIDRLSDEDCAHLLLDRIRELDDHRRFRALPAALEAVGLLGRVPLAVHLAGSAQGSSVARHTLSGYVGELSRAPVGRPGLRADEPAYHLLRALRPALDAFGAEEKDTALRLLAVLAGSAPGRPFPLGALVVATGPAETPLAYRSVRLLAQSGIVTIGTDDNLHVATIHPLVARAAAHLDGGPATAAQSVRGAAAGALDAMTRPGGSTRPGDDEWQLWRLLIPHVRHVLTSPGSDGDVVVLRVAHRAVRQLTSHGMHRAAAQLAEDALGRTGSLPAGQEGAHRTALLDRGLTLQACGDDLKGAFRHLSDVALRTRRDCPPDDPEAMHAGHCLAAVLHELGDLTEAEQLFRPVLDARRDVLGAGHPDTLTTMQCLAAVLQAAGRAGEAEEMLQQVHSGRVRQLGPDHPDTLTTRHSIAYARQAAGGPGAERDFAQVLADRRRVLGETHPNTLITRHNLAWIEQAGGNYAAAEDQFRAVLQLQIPRLGRAHPHTVATAANLAWDLLQQRQFTTARLLFTQVLKIRTGRLGSLHPDTQTTRGNLGWLTYEEGDFVRAERRFRKLLGDRTRLLGDHHPRTLTTRHNLALSLRSQRRLPEARDEFISVLGDQERVIGGSHDSTLATRYNLAVTLRMLNDDMWLTEAMSLLDSVLATLRGRPNPLLRQTKRELVTLLAIRSGRADVHELLDDATFEAPPTTTADDPLVRRFVDDDIDDFVDPDLTD
ncbi:hypothetical protein AFR_24925 [Actinoplanes friuliensis DSM 7358]|uniref:Uncharacterized protein n=1 Tax=Actinoplanes friuliensis DSM 7358 TaxID=1246995 RepID=U5W5P8_9ACTN|nr:hypothetical protein AFR_24925 [Actinoplanes friuliensis DSM 7358]